MDYPASFPEHLTSPIDTAIADAEITFAAAQLHASRPEPHVVDYVKRIYVAFCHGVCKAVSEGHWTAERARREFKEQLRLWASSACFEKARGIYGNNTTERIQHQVQADLQSSGEWAQIQTALIDAIRLRQRETTRTVNNQVAANLKQYRAEAGWSQKEMAARVEINIRNIQRHESGDTRKIRLEHRRKYESVLSLRLGRDIKLDPETP
jgi:ribosome-binding protein aMBF1 (putative translation factor)